MMGIVDVFSAPVNIIKNNPVILLPYLLYSIVLIGIPLSLLYSILPASFLSTPGQVSSSLPTLPAGTLIALLVTVAVIGLVALFISPIFIGMYISIAKQGRSNAKVSLSKAYNEAKARYLSLLGAFVLAGIIVIVLIGLLIGIALLFALAGGALAIVGILLLIIFLIIAGVVLAIIFFQIGVSVMLESKGAVDGIKRSIDIGKGNAAAIFGTVVLAGIISFVISFVLNIIGLIFLLGGPTGYLAGQVIIEIIMMAFLGVWFGMVPATFYYNYVVAPRTKLKTAAAKQNK